MRFTFSACTGVAAEELYEKLERGIQKSPGGFLCSYISLSLSSPSTRSGSKNDEYINTRGET